jgi:hypothetical protein
MPNTLPLFAGQPDDVVLLGAGPCAPRSEQGRAWLAVLRPSGVVGVEAAGQRIDAVGTFGDRDFVVVSGGGTFTGVTVQSASVVEASAGALVSRDLGTVYEDTCGAPMAADKRTTWRVLVQRSSARSVGDLDTLPHSTACK